MKYLLILLPALSFASSLKTFKTDYCTYFFNGTLSSPELWKDCCIAHDLDYWVGGTEVDQQKSDKRLQQCIADKGVPWVGVIVYRGVRLGHHSPIKNKFHWAWGWEKKKHFEALSKKNITYIKTVLDYVEVTDEIKTKFIKERLENETVHTNKL
jgi:hypothetical protein